LTPGAYTANTPGVRAVGAVCAPGIALRPPFRLVDADAP
jgi:hypothetical protein